MFVVPTIAVLSSLRNIFAQSADKNYFYEAMPTIGNPLGLSSRGAPLAARFQYGKGKVLVSSCHPESYESTHDIALGYVLAVTGVKPVPFYPAKISRPLRVGWFSLACRGTRAAHELLALDNEAAFDVEIFNLHEINDGRLRHYDVVVLPDGLDLSYKNFMKNEFQKKQILDFLERGGHIVASGNGGKYLPEHPNVQILPVGEPFAKALVK